MKILKVIGKKWRNFWGHRYYIIDEETNKELGSVLFYGHKIYIKHK